MESTRARPVAAPVLRTDLQTESWRLLRAEWAADPAAQSECADWERRRAGVRPQMLALLQRFLSGAIGLEQFRATFDRRTRTDWDAFGLKGASGAMFLNALAKHAARPIVLARRLRAALEAPSDIRDAATRFDGFLAAVAPPVLPLEPLDSAAVPAAMIAGRPDTPVSHPARAVFFASMCWHLQAPDRWPAFQPSARQVLQEEEELFLPTGDPVTDYLRFRDAFLSITAELSLTVWQLEHLCWWHARRLERTADDWADGEPVVRSAASRLRGYGRTRRGVPPSPEPRHAASRSVIRETPPPYVPYVEQPTLDHTHVQWLLAKVGHQLGCRVWIAANDHRRQWGGESLGSLSVPRLPPLGLDPDSQRAVALIDVVWLSGTNQVTAAFEVEHTTAVYSGLLRLADLAALAPNLSFPLYIVATASRLAKVRRELSRPTFRAVDLHRRCGFFSGEALLRALPGLTRWATGPSAVEKLAERVE